MSVNKVQLANGETIIDISDSTVTSETLAEGVTAHDASGRKITGKMIPGGGRSVQSDWNQTDETAADFIKNKTHYKRLNVIMEEQELAYDTESDSFVATVSASINTGDVIVVVFNGETYECTVGFNEDAYAPVFGNYAPLGGEDTGEPFCGVYAEGMVMLVALNEVSHVTMKISVTEFVKMPERYFLKKFYANLVDSYLYIDSGLTTKATVGDIPDSTNFEIGLTQFAAVYSWHKPITVHSKFKNEATGYAQVFALNNEQLVQFYTAEYTPPTT